jgi:hypothetical protein
MLLFNLNNYLITLCIIYIDLEFLFHSLSINFFLQLGMFEIIDEKSRQKKNVYGCMYVSGSQSVCCDTLVCFEMYLDVNLCALIH